MATKAKPRKKAPDILDHQKPKNDWDKFLVQVKESPLVYAGIVLFLLLCILVGVLYRAGSDASRRAKDTQLAQALEADDSALRVTELEPLTGAKGSVGAQALYMLGESAFRAKEYDKAKESFERMRREFPDSSYTPTAVEGLGLLAESDGRYEDAVTLFREVIDKWPDSFARRRQSVNIGRADEHLLDLAGAVAAYQAQVDQYPESPFAVEAKSALDRLQKTNPELFPKPAAPEQAPAAEGAPAAPAAPEKASATPAAPATPAAAAATEKAPAETPPSAAPVTESPAAPAVPEQGEKAPAPPAS